MNTDKHHGVSYFEVAEHTIKVVVSFISGLEQIYVDDQLVSSSRNWWLRSVHSFELDGQPAEVRIRTVSLFKGPLQIELHVDGHYQDGDEWDLPRMMEQLNNGKKTKWWVLMLIMFAFGFLGGAFGFGLGIWFKG
ncbi:hypothetical protein Q3O60_12695 [Alkalimonas collagenimarina]|uniref:Uncharacterized protein n=1 Tax=Alkalimonas collagenimarina TaxID=400390 RepID=A0ABT9H151_9GAMM|nr:hypothetical protein [Alkalimonas collagenimarina]MDP4537051.1 hypothetical protein [Alkalimonas collagenimarina]